VAKRRIRAALLQFAENIRAIRRGRPDWYVVAEKLAEIGRPELLGDNIMTRGPGRPAKTDNAFLAVEVHRVMWTHGVDVAEACRRISRGSDKAGDKLPVRVWSLSEGAPTSIPGYTHGSPWRGIKWQTLERRYWKWRKAEEARREALAERARKKIDCGN
jgi:hypothetical protein